MNANQTVVYRMAGMDDVAVRRDVEYGEGLRFDLYNPPGRGRVPAVVIVAGYPDAGFEKMLGCKFKDMGSSTSWGRLIAASGMAAITYTNREPEADLHAVLAHVRSHSEELGIDASRMGVWASSGNVPLALSLLMMGLEHVKCAALCYGMTLDLDGSRWVADAAKQFGFANPCAGKSVDDLPRDVPLFLARAGKDAIPHLNDAMDRFVAHALARNLAVTLVNHPEAPHAFDLVDDSEMTREIVRRILGFLRFALLSCDF